MKKMFSILIMLVLLMTTAISASAKSVITVGDWTVEKVDDGFSIVSCSSDQSSITLIKDIGGTDVTAIGEYAFSGSDTLQAFTASAPLRRIDGYAFQNASKLHAVSLPSSLNMIGVFAFAGTSLLRDINLEDTSVGAIPAYAFMSSGIQTVTLPKSCTYIANNAFLNCTALKTVYIPDSVTDIGEKSFDGCDSLTILCAPDSYAAQYAKAHHISTNDSVLCGDADNDGTVTILDATAIQRKLVDFKTSSFNKRAADIDGDGLDILDATRIQRFLVGFPIPYAVGKRIAV